MTPSSPSLSPFPSPEPKPGVDMGGQLAATVNTFIDPPAVSKVVPTKASWLVPFVLICIANMVMAYVVVPISANVFRMNPPDNIPPERVQQTADMMEKFGMIGLVTAPITVAIISLLITAVILGACSVSGIKARFGDLFAMLCYGGLIRALGVVAGAIVLKVKAAEIQTMGELAPRFGLDLVITDAPKFLMGILRFFSIFTIWEMIVSVVIFSTTLHITKGKAVGVLLPAWVIGLLLTIASVYFQR